MYSFITIFLFGCFASWAITTTLYSVKAKAPVSHLFIGLTYTVGILIAEIFSALIPISIPIFLQLVVVNILVSWLVISFSSNVAGWVSFENNVAKTWTIALFFFITVLSLFICY